MNALKKKFNNFKADSVFEKVSRNVIQWIINHFQARLAATFAGDKSAAREKDIISNSSSVLKPLQPQQIHLIGILSAFNGTDPETKPADAFKTIINKLKTSDSRTKWNYIIKNLIILDRAIEEGLFVVDISELSIPDIEKFKCDEDRYSNSTI